MILDRIFWEIFQLFNQNKFLASYFTYFLNLITFLFFTALCYYSNGKRASEIKEPTNYRNIKILRLVLCNRIILDGVYFIFCAFLYSSRCYFDNYSWKIFFKDFLVINIFIEFFTFYGHYFVHSHYANKFNLKKYHDVHHSFKHIEPIHAFYFHPIDYLILNNLIQTASE